MTTLNLYRACSNHVQLVKQECYNAYYANSLDSTVNRGYFDSSYKLIEQAITIVRIAPLALLFRFACSSETETCTRLKQVPTCAADDFGHNSTRLQATTSKRALKRAADDSRFSAVEIAPRQFTNLTKHNDSKSSSSGAK